MTLYLMFSSLILFLFLEFKNVFSHNCAHDVQYTEWLYTVKLQCICLTIILYFVDKNMQEQVDAQLLDQPFSVPYQSKE